MTNPNAGDLVKTSASAILASVVRTLVPILVGVIVSVAAKLNVDLDAGTAETLVNGLISAAISLLYYVIARVLELFQSSKFGWLLGFAKAPAYKA